MIYNATRTLTPNFVKIDRVEIQDATSRVRQESEHAPLSAIRERCLLQRRTSLNFCTGVELDQSSACQALSSSGPWGVWVRERGVRVRERGCELRHSAEFELDDILRGAPGKGGRPLKGLLKEREALVEAKLISETHPTLKINKYSL